MLSLDIFTLLFGKHMRVSGKIIGSAGAKKEEGLPPLLGLHR